MELKDMTLNNNNITTTIDTIRNELAKGSKNQVSHLKLELIVEEILLRYKEHFEQEIKFDFRINKRFSTILVELSIAGPEASLISSKTGDDKKFDEILHTMLGWGDIKVSYSYRNGKNIISFIDYRKPEKSKGKLPGNPIVWAILLAIPFSLLAKNLPIDIQKSIVDSVTYPVNNTLISLLKGVTGPVVAVSLICGIIALDDLEKLNKIGKKIIFRFMGISLGMAIFSTIVCLLLFDFSGSNTASLALGEVVELFLGIIPTDIIAPFANGNVTHMILISFVVGIAFLAVGEKVNGLRQIVSDLNFLMFYFLNLVTKVIPLMIFLSIFNIVLTMETKQIAIIWKAVVAQCIVMVTISAFMLIFVSLKHKIKLFAILKCLFPIMMIGLSTGSSSATISEIFDLSKEKLKINENFVSYWVPLSFSLFSPINVQSLTVLSLFASSLDGISITPIWLILLLILVIQLSIAVPKVNGALVAMITILLTQLGISSDNVGLLVAVYTLVVNISTMWGGLYRVVEEIDLAISEGEMNPDVLR